MDKVRLGRTELMVTKTSFGALPIQRISEADAVKLVRRAYESGINYFDTANMYTDSEAKLGKALRDVRQNVVISTKSAGTDKKTVLAHIEESLRRLQTDYIDLIRKIRMDLLRRRWRCSRRGMSAISASQTIGCILQRRRWNPVTLQRFSSLSAISPDSRNWIWWRSARSGMWASLR